MRKPKQPGSAPHTHGWALGVQGQLMLFLCGITVLTLGLVWGLITYGLQPITAPQQDMDAILGRK